MARSKAVSWQSIADQLGINVSTIYDFRKESGAPKDSKEISDWNAFIARRNAPATSLVSPDANSSNESPDDMASYCKQVSDGRTTWKEVLVKQQAIGEFIKNQRLKAELAVAMKDMLTRDQAKARANAWNAAADARMDLVERLLDYVENVSPDQRRVFLDGAREWRLNTKKALKEVHSDV